MHEKSSILVFGEVLFDHFPDGSRVLGGAPFNVAWHLQAFGQNPSFISRVGDDISGRAIASKMDAWGLSCDRLQFDRNHPTGSVQVKITNGEPEYDIVAGVAYDFIDAELIPNHYQAEILYHGSLAVRNPVSKAALSKLRSNQQGKIFVDVNLRSPWWDLESLRGLLKEANWVKLNEAELELLCPKSVSMESAMETFYELHDLDTLVVTRGENGAVAIDSRHHRFAVYPSTNLDIVDTVGAGDAFASVLLLGIRCSWPLELALERAQAFAGAVVSQRGATIADQALYQAQAKMWDL